VLINVQDEYMAPEMLFDEDFSHPADMFSFGMVLLELITRRKVGEDGFARRSPAKLFALDEDEVRAAAPSDTPPSLVTLTIQW
jgi:Protein tyrosine and serine/threonine kinase